MTITKWILNQAFKNYRNGLYLEIIKNIYQPFPITYKPFIKRSWNCYSHILFPTSHEINKIHPSVKYITGNIYDPNNFEKLLSGLNNNGAPKLNLNFNNKYHFTHCLVAHTSKIYHLFGEINLHKYRFGVLILKVSDKIKFTRDRNKVMKLLRTNYYEFYDQIDQYDCYVCSIGFSPYYFGQQILDKYTITGNFKSGCGSSGVFMVRDEANNKYVLKRSNSKKTFLKELVALKNTKEWKHSPSLIDYHISDNIIITNWCGNDLKLLDISAKEKYRGDVQQLVDILYKKFNLYHNDIRWKNITISNNNIILIDWGMANLDNRERDPEHILRFDQRENIKGDYQIDDIHLSKNKVNGLLNDI